MVQPLSKYSVSDEAFNLKNLMDRVLETIVSIYESYNAPLPTRRFWTIGAPSMDCEQVSVSMVQMYLGAPGDEAADPQHCNAPRTAVLSISVARDWPMGNNGNALTPETYMAAAEYQAMDAWILIESVDQFDTWGDLGRGPGVIATIDTPEPQGAIQEVRMTLTISVP